jgi:hypothetical protein
MFAHERSPNQSTFMGGTLADSDVTKKLKIYHTLYLLNLSFARIVAHCQTLHEAGIFKPKFSRLYQAYAQELQAEINDEALDTVTSIEADDMHRFGKVRDARDMELRDPDDVFIHAEERRKELAKQGKKPRRKKSA